MDRPKITINDVARKAGVSKGTVDRVVYNRGEVSKKSELKVRKAIEELGYEPNLHASLLASRQTRMLACLLPRFVAGEFWEKMHKGFIAGSEDASRMGITTRTFLYDQYDPDSFSEAAAEMLAADPAGVLFPPMFGTDSLVLAGELHRRGIPYVYVDTKLDDDEGYLAYFGTPMFESGVLCARLLTERLTRADIDRVAVIRINRDKGGLADPTAHRRAGFTDFFREKFPSAEIFNVFITPSDPEGSYRVLDEFFSSHPGIRYVAMFSSRVHLLAGYLKDHPDPARRLIGYDNLEGNMALLKDGLVDILIAQHAEQQSSQAVKVLADFILLKKRPPLRDNYMHMDILTRYNDENY